MMRYDIGRRLEPIRPVADLDRGFRAEVADPTWFLARQWQLGEHQGEDAASPTLVRHVTTHDPIDPLDGDPATDPTLVPAEAIIESEPDEWWTPGRRIRIGRDAAPVVPADHAADASLRLAGLPVPYDQFDGSGLDGLALYRRRAELGLPDTLFADVPAPPADLWDPSEFVHSAAFTSGPATLSVPRHDGGAVDWYSVSADRPLPGPPIPPAPVEVLPARMKYPGAPHPRWWQIENAHVDIGGFPPDRSHFATTLLIDLVMSHADDWFSFPVQTQAGKLVTLRKVIVLDAFDEKTILQPPSDWSLFRVTGLSATTLMVWPTAVTPLTSQPMDDVVIGVDEDANLLWAVEQRVGGWELAPPPPAEPTPTPAPPGQVLANERVQYDYLLSSRLPRYWHPYQIHEPNGRRTFVQGRLADLQATPPAPMSAPVSPLLHDPHAPASGPAHRIEPSAVPATGLRLQRQWVLARRTNGVPVLWMQRRRLPLHGPPVSGLRFDVVSEVPTVTTP
ncbi:hypothetical protein ACIHCQ_41685 [Streptomyces sp. NPDC052236]|uniref:hypothetical protein n=1 Tax=Streptomyces sp. NPDC052236 TaxID=3365686 RepID=UPI0037CF4502